MKARCFSARREGDSIFISIVDESNQTIFKGMAKTNDKKGIANLLSALRQKGVELKEKVDWLD